MYGHDAGPIGRSARRRRDWTMFGFYIRNNIGIAFQCFAGGLFAGVGSLFFLVYNGASSARVAGYLTERGLGDTSISFVVTHGAFELTGIVLSGAAGLDARPCAAGARPALAPGRARARGAATRSSSSTASRRCCVVAAAVEAFWSSARWVPAPVKYGVAAACWVAVLALLRCSRAAVQH